MHYNTRLPEAETAFLAENLNLVAHDGNPRPGHR